MLDHNPNREDAPIYLSPLRLLCTAYTDQQPVIDPAESECFEALDRCLAPLSDRDKTAVFHTICRLCTEKQELAFLAGIRTGVRLVLDLADV